MINKLLAVLFAAVLVGCAQSSYQSLTPGAAPISAAGAQYTGAHDARFAKLSSVQLQDRRLELYQQLPRFAQRFGGNTHQYNTAYVTHGGPLPQQDEIVLIERELNWRYSHGDKAAYFEAGAPKVPPYSQQSG